MENTSRNFLFTWRNPDCVLRSGTNTGLRDSWVFSHTRIILSTFIITLLESSSWLRIRVVKNNTAMIFSPWCQKIMIDFLVNCRHLFSHLPAGRADKSKPLWFNTYKSTNSYYIWKTDDEITLKHARLGIWHFKTEYW